MAGISSGLIGGVISVFIMAALTPLIKKGWRKWHALKFPNYSRELKQAELNWINRTSLQLAQEKSDQKYSRWTWLLSGGLIPVSVGMGLTLVILIVSLNVLSKDVPTDVLTWVRIPIGISSVLGVFLGIFLAAIAMIWFVKHNSVARDYLTYQYGWGYALPRQRGVEEIKEELEHFLRAGDLAHLPNYDSDLFSNLIFHRTAPAWKGWTIGIAVVTSVFLVLDSRFYLNVFPDRIETSPYLSLSDKVYRYDDVIAVHRKCTLASNDKVPYPSFKYVLEMSDGVKVSLLGGEDTPIATELSAIELITPQLKNATFEQTIIKSAPVVKLAPTFENCAKLLRSSKPKNQAETYRRLFDLP
jgi:hypothetical protein